MTFRKACVYARLSREDERTPGTTEEKLNAQVESCRRLAASHNLPVHEVLIERASGGSLSGRPELLKLLHLCRRGEVSHILCTFSDRLSRLDGRDRVDFEEALTDGCVTVITTTGITPYNHDEEPFGRRVLAEAAAYELRAFGRRLKERNKQKIAENKRTGGGVPYGYKRDKSAPGGYTPCPHEYPVLCQMLRAILDGRSIHGIVSELIAGNVPSKRGGKWHVETVQRQLSNPFYCGRHAHRVMKESRGGVKRLVKIPSDEWQIAPTAGDWEYPLTFEEHCAIVAAFRGRYRPVPRVGLLTGLLWCPEGGRMARMGAIRYQCFCARHDGIYRSCNRQKIEAEVVDVIRDAFERMNPDALGMLQSKESRSNLYLLHAKAQRTTREAFSALEQLASSRDMLLQYSDSGAYEEMLRRAGQAHSAARTEEARLSALLSQPEFDAIMPIVKAVGEAGFDVTWERMTEDERRTLLRDSIVRIDLPPKNSHKGKKWGPPIVTLAEWVKRAIGQT